MFAFSSRPGGVGRRIPPGPSLSFLSPALGAFLVVLGFSITARLEERFLREELGPADYDAYRRRTAMLVPGLRFQRK